MKIAILRKKYTFHGGAESFSGSFIERLAAEGHEVHIFAIKWQGEGPGNNIFFHKVPAITFNSFLRDLSFALAARSILKRLRKDFDIIQSHDKTLYQDIYRAGDGCHIEWLKQRWKRTGLPGKLSMLLNPYHWLSLGMERDIFKGHRYKKIIAISEMVKRNIIEHYKVQPSDIEVIYNGVDLKKFHPDNKIRFRDETRQKYGLTDNDFVVLFAGSGFERKGVRYLLEAVESITEPVSVLILGKGSEKKLKKISPGPSLPKRGNQRIIFCGPQKDIEKYYAAADLFVFPTMYEPFGNVHLEALASGLPVITTKNSGAAEIIRDGANGFVVDRPEDSGKIAGRIQSCLDDRDKLKLMSEKARQLAEEFSFESHIGKIQALYEKIVAERNKSN